MQELSNVHGLYDKLKASAAASTEPLLSSLQLARKDLVPQLHRTMVDYHQWQQMEVRRALYTPRVVC